MPRLAKFLQLMIHSLYTNKEIFLRELISNASDACDKLRYEALEKSDLLSEDQELKISISIDKESSLLTISDNGIGMNEEDMIQNLGTIASSGTQKFLESVGGDNKPDLSLIGQFGVGFYSAFMISDEVKVISRKVGEDKSYTWSSSGDGNYTIAEGENNREQNGTSIILKVRDSEVSFLEQHRLQHIIKTYSDHISFPIELIDAEGKAEVINNRSALWVRPKSDITDEQYEEFYHHVSHSPDKPWYRIHSKAEGNIEYTSLLYIPSMKPFDLFNPERATRVKLYIKRVFITDQGVRLVPEYMRFLRGVVDSEDLPLNISRETLQDNIIIDRIRKSIVKKVLSSLKKKSEDDKQEYKKFWENFGEVMKEGLCEGALEEKEQLLEVCRFKTSKSGDEYVSLDEYIDNMKEGQDNIFYITGDNPEKLMNNPQLEGFKKRDIEVLLLSDHVDDFWVNVINTYKNKEMKSVASSEIDLDAIENLNEKVEDRAADDSAKTDNSQDHEQLIERIKQVLGDRVKDVKVSSKLVDSPACLAVSEGGMSVRMEKYLIEQKQLSARSAKILEINPAHPLVARIANDIKASNDNEDVDNLIQIVFDQACIADGENVHDPQAFIQRMNNFLSKVI